MPKVPVDNTPSISPAGAPGAYLRIGADPSMFGSQEGAGMSNLGHALEQAGSITAEMAIRDQRLKTEAQLVGSPKATEPAIAFQKQKNETDVDAAYADNFSPAFRKLYQEFYSKQSKDALDAMPEFTGRMNELRQSVRDSMPNDVQRHMFDQVSRRRVEAELDGMARYSEQQFKVWQHQTSDAFLSNQAMQAADFWNDDQRFGAALGAGLGEIDRFGASAGQSAEMMKMRASKFISEANVHRISAAITQDPVAASDMYMKARNEIEPAMRDHLERQLKSAVLPVLARDIASEAMRGNPLPPGIPEEERDAYDEAIKQTKAGNKRIIIPGDFRAEQDSTTDIRAKLGEWVKRGEELAEKARPGDPVFRDLVTSRIRNDVSVLAVAQDGIEKQNRDRLVLAVNEGKYTSIEQLTASSQQNALAYYNATPQVQAAVERRINQNAKGTKLRLDEESFGLYYGAVGRATNDPAAFSNENLTELYGKIPDEYMNRLIGMQVSIDKNAAKQQQSATTIGHAKEVTRPMVLAAGIKIPSKPGEAAKVYDQFVGRLQEGLDKYYEENKKRPSDSDIRDMGKALLVDGAEAGSGWLWDTGKKAFQVPAEQFYVPVPKAERVKIIESYKQIRGTQPSDAEIRRIFTASKLQGKK